MNDEEEIGSIELGVENTGRLSFARKSETRRDPIEAEAEAEKSYGFYTIYVLRSFVRILIVYDYI